MKEWYATPLHVEITDHLVDEPDGEDKEGKLPNDLCNYFKRSLVFIIFRITYPIPFNTRTIGMIANTEY